MTLVPTRVGCPGSLQCQESCRSLRMERSAYRGLCLATDVIEVEVTEEVQSILDVMPGYFRRSSWRGQETNLPTLLAKLKHSNATDPRDNIYALVGSRPISEPMANSSLTSLSRTRQPPSAPSRTWSLARIHAPPFARCHCGVSVFLPNICTSRLSEFLNGNKRL